MKKILITGANGFIGSHVTELFCEKGFVPGCFVRETADLEHLNMLEVEYHYGDLLDYHSLEQAAENMETIIHIAALVKDWGNYNAFYETNVVGTLNVLRAGYNAGVGHIIITGSISSYGEEHNLSVKDENSPYNSHYPYFMDSIFPCRMNYYRDTKAIATQKAIQYAESKNLNLTVIEPVWVYGEREYNTGFYEYMKTVRSGVPFMPGTENNKFHVIYAKDLASAYYSAFIKNIQGIQRFIIGDDKPVFMDRLFKNFCEEIGIKKPRNISKLWVYPLAFILEFLYTIFRSSYPPFLTRGRVNMFYDNIEYSTEKARSILEFNNKYNLENACKRTVQWYKKNNLI